MLEARVGVNDHRVSEWRWDRIVLDQFQILSIRRRSGRCLSRTVCAEDLLAVGREMQRCDRGIEFDFVGMIVVGGRSRSSDRPHTDSARLFCRGVAGGENFGLPRTPSKGLRSQVRTHSITNRS